MYNETNTKLSPVDTVISYIQQAITNKDYLPGDRLPAERKLSEMLGVGRPNIRKAIQKLELYGIVKTFPQSGTVISSFTKEQFDQMFNETLKVSKYDFYSLVHVRALLESEACILAAKNRTQEDLEKIEKVLKTLEQTSDADKRMKLDFDFHQAIAHSSHNEVLSSLLLIITPDIMKYYHRFRLCTTSERTTESEHREYMQKIKEQDVKGIKELVQRHLSNQIDFAQNIKGTDIPDFQFHGR